MKKIINKKVRKLVKDRVLDKFNLGKKEIFICKDIAIAQKKLERSIATNRFIKKGEVIGKEDIHLLSPGDGYKWNDKKLLIGKSVNCNIPENEIIYPNMLS